MYPNKGESEGYTVKSKDEAFPISNYPLEQSEFYYGQKQGMTSSPNSSIIKFFSPRLSILKSTSTNILQLDSKGRDKLGSEKNKEFDYSMFQYGNDNIEL